MKVKICGITEVETAKFAVESGADALGFVFANSKRKIDPEKAKQIIDQLPDSILKVGVFVNETKETIRQITNQTGINAIQLHGDESPEFCRNLEVTGTTNAAKSTAKIKAFSINAREDLQQLEGYDCDYVLLDSARGKYHGGNGVAFDWTMLEGIELVDKKVILAGGLSPQNVAEAITQTNPYMVDVSSGVETNGKKDMEKIKAFIKEAKSNLKEEVR
ncbi:phosphoribosylanthranilate isomerase [Cytobacillus purgationiresistens]|uniref:N-(5'-phosphoribosyl)anthranilate isomerase n=1 Tax=Cytobacillus purgationiresistens TaxID=863449 RepID=A0ABU0AHK5_9BACI|nr:phosphoribosylanthranilate isomerase [Cytobacillus purgationiresistens]MDQ0270364.1 phosphoribosylanthranilate isomerase [Cytobacillus purgationiresistens]